jgi:hypothetical protein
MPVLIDFFRSDFEQGIVWCRKVGVGDGKRIAGYVELG